MLFPAIGMGIAIAIGLLIAAGRFSLRTLLIATAVVAVVLGLVVWAVQ